MRAVAIDHVVLRVVDLTRATRFYEDVLGCRIERDRPELGMTQLRVGTALIDLIAIDGRLGRQGGARPGEEGRNMDHLCLRIADFEVDRVVAELEGAGAEVNATDRRYGSTGEAISVYAKDPDGNGLELRA